MRNSLIIVVLFLFCLTPFCFCNAAESVYSKKETLYSTKNGSRIGDLLLTIEPKNNSPSNNEWVLIIGDKGNPFFDSRTERSLWIFNKKLNANTFRRDMRNRDYPVDIKDINEFMPFCENGIRFEIKDWDELSRQTQVTFFLNASQGQTVTLRLVFYTSYIDKKRTTIDDESKVRIEFVVPDLTARANQMQQSGGSGGSGGTQGGEVISLTEKIDYDAVAKFREEQQANSLSEEDRDERIALLNSFISERNREINEFQEQVNILLADNETKVTESTIDSLTTIANEMKNRVDYWENGYSDILLTEETIHDKFSKFRIAHTLSLKKIDELKQRQNPFYGILEFAKNNILLTVGAGVGGLILLKLLLSLFKKLKSMIKSKINQKISKMKTDTKKKVTEKPKKWTLKRNKKKNPDDDFENIDINDLAEI